MQSHGTEGVLLCHVTHLAHLTTQRTANWCRHGTLVMSIRHVHGVIDQDRDAFLTHLDEHVPPGSP